MMNTIHPTLPVISLGEHQVSRLIIGDNPIYGYSHFNQLLSQHQRDAHSPDQVMATLKRAEEVGIKAWQNTPIIWRAPQPVRKNSANPRRTASAIHETQQAARDQPAL